MSEVHMKQNLAIGQKLLDLTYAQLAWVFVFAWLCYTLGMTFFVSDGLANHTTARAYSDWMSQIIPMINSISKIPGASEWNRFYYSVMWAITPIFMTIGWLLRRRMCVQGIYLKPMSDIRLIVSILGLALFCAILLWWPLDDGKGWRDQAAVDRLFGVAHFSFCAFGFALMAGGYFRLIYARIKFGTITEPIYQGDR